MILCKDQCDYFVCLLNPLIIYFANVNLKEAEAKATAETTVNIIGTGVSSGYFYKLKCQRSYFEILSPLSLNTLHNYALYILHTICSPRGFRFYRQGVIRKPLNLRMPGCKECFLRRSMYASAGGFHELKADRKRRQRARAIVPWYFLLFLCWIASFMMPCIHGIIIALHI